MTISCSPLLQKRSTVTAAGALQWAGGVSTRGGENVNVFFSGGAAADPWTTSTEVAVTSGVWTGAHLWRFGCLAFARDGLGMTFWAGYSNSSSTSADPTQQMLGNLSGTIYNAFFSGSTISSRSGPAPSRSISGRSRRETRMLYCRSAWRRQTNPSSTSLLAYRRTFDVKAIVPAWSAAQTTGTWLALGIGLFFVGWVIQFIGHIFEGRKPAFVDDLIGLVVGPLFVVAEAGFETPKRVATFLAPAARYTANRATLASLVDSLRHGAPETKDLAFPEPIGQRTAVRLRSADEVLLPAVWPSIELVEFRVAPNVVGGNALLGIARHWAPLWLAPLARLLGSRVGCFGVEVSDGVRTHARTQNSASINGEV